MQRQANTAGFASVRGKSSKVIDLSKGVISPSKVPVNYNAYISTENLNKLKSLRYTSGITIVDPDLSIGMDIFYELLNKIVTDGFDKIYVYLTSKQWVDENDLYFSLPDFDNSEYRYLRYIEVYHDEREMVAGIYKCKYCKGSNTYTIERQTRSGDEAALVKVFCINCDRSWNA
jgi:DNA-directed RNA polymerase subunit M/transcription elongation factor TFIIS